MKKKIYNMLKLCTSSWNVSGLRPLLPTSLGVEEKTAGVPFYVDAVFILFLCLCPAQSGPTELYISTDPDGLGPLYQPHSLSLHQQEEGGTFQEVQSLKKNFWKKKKQEKATFQDLQSCSTQAKITIACFCNCLDPSSDRPNSRGPPSILY